jgi:dUTP pyrophosphatase
VVKPGDKITQLVVVPVTIEPVEIVDELDGGERGSAGFGSTGR